MKKIIIFMGLLASNAFAISLGDTVNSNTMAMETTVNRTMKLSVTNANNTEYKISKASGADTVLVNKNNKVYGFKWNDKTPDVKTMLGTNTIYKSEFDAAYAKRHMGDHRRLMINTEHLSVSQFGLPGGPFSGSMTAKDLAPTN